MFSDIPIHYFSGTHRAIEPSKTIANYENKLKIVGITRITEITHLDRVGIPVYSAIRPTAQDGGVSIYAGKGVKKEQAKASAMMEGFERYSAEKQDIDNEKSIITTFNNLKNSSIINPKDLTLPNETKNLDFDTVEIEWTLATDIATEKEYYVPSNAIFHPYIPKNSTPLFKGNTNGLASGNVLEEAVLHGILEVIERDAWSIFELTKKNKKQIDTKSIKNPLINDLLNKFKKEAIDIKLMDLTADVNIPTIAATADDTILKDPALLTFGVGTHLNPEIAIMRALTEVAQSRATQIHGAREDTVRADFMRKAGYKRMKRINNHYFSEEKEQVKIEDIENKATDSLKKDIEIAVSELKNFSLNKILFTDLTREELGVNVVRVIIPGTETYSVDPDRIGNRWIEFDNKSKS
ncbi:MAG: YcaO-related McrA-glycine thioamidation protein [Methanobacteriaceae archaeon]|jgi:ribosomal protein S12 methylthiotransferase accessory factor|nr:YcaO-related McrA-glycine thioamidation protein [Candidatus Methanorudis spinitermitis]